MKEKDSHLKDRFCYTMEMAGKQMVCESVIKISNDLLLYDEADIPGVLLQRKRMIRHQLEQSDYMVCFPFNAIHQDLHGNLANYYNKFISCNAVGLLHRRSLKRGQSAWNLVPGIFADTSLQLLHCKHAEFDFSTLEVFKPIVVHIFLCGFFRELNKMIDRYTMEGAMQQPVSGPLDSPVSVLLSSIFNEGGYELFCYLNENYSMRKKCLNAKFSSLYHFLKHENKLVGTQAEYMNFISAEMHVTMSKILPKSLKYEDAIFPLLSRLRSNFGKRNKMDEK